MAATMKFLAIAVLFCLPIGIFGKGGGGGAGRGGSSGKGSGDNSTQDGTEVNPCLQLPPEEDGMKFEFNQARIVPGVISKAPQRMLLMDYSPKKNGSDLIINGEYLRVPQVNMIPKVTMALPSGTFYMLVLMDIDYRLSNGMKAENIIWWVVNIAGDITRGRNLFDYRKTNFGRPTGSHRYVTLVFNQGKSYIPVDEWKKNSTKIRQTQNFKTLEHTYGRPMYGAYFWCQH